MYFYGQNCANDSSLMRRGDESSKNMFHALDRETLKYGAPLPTVELEQRDWDVVIEERVRNIVLFLGLNPKNKGFLLAVKGCVEAYKNPILLDKLSKEFYPLLAYECDSTVTRAERCIRHELHKCFDEGNLKNVNVLFKMHLWDESQRMSNGEFFSLVVQKLSMELGVYR